MVCCLVSVQIQKMATVVREQNSVFRGGECQNLGIRHRGVGPSRVKRSQHIVTETPEFCNDLKGNILVCVKASH